MQCPALWYHRWCRITRYVHSLAQYVTDYLVVSAPIDFYLWLPTLTHPTFPFNTWKEIVWPELSGIIFNLYNDKASDWGVMSKHYFFTNSLPKLLCGTAVPLAIGGLAWIASLVSAPGAKGKNDNVWSKWTRSTGRNVGEVVWTFGPGVVGLLGGMSLVGHKVSLLYNRCKQGG
jgi:alpha-1,6-mannosyltransferase